MISYLSIIDDSLFYIYSLLAVAGIYYFRSNTSLGITALVLAAADGLMNLGREPLLEYVSDNREYGHLIWCGTWMVSNYIALHVLQAFHKRLDVKTGKAAFFTSQCMVSIMALQALLYINSSAFESPYQVLDDIYQYGIPSINVLMGACVSLAFGKEFINGLMDRHSIND